MSSKKQSSETVKHIMYGILVLAFVLVIAGIIFIALGTKGFAEISFENVRIVSDVIGIILVFFGFWLMLRLIEIIRKIIDEGVLPDAIQRMDTYSKFLRMKL